MSPRPEEEAQLETDDDWGWHEDPTAEKTVDGKLNQMGRELRQLTAASLVATLIVAAAVGVVEHLQGNGFPNTCGFVVGGVLAIVNLWILAGGYFALIDRRALTLRVLLAALGSLVVLLGAGLYLLAAHRSWTVGFATGLTIPALGGILHAFRRAREES